MQKGSKGLDDATTLLLGQETESQLLEGLLASNCTPCPTILPVIVMVVCPSMLLLAAFTVALLFVNLPLLLPLLACLFVLLTVLGPSASVKLPTIMELQHPKKVFVVCTFNSWDICFKACWGS